MLSTERNDLLWPWALGYVLASISDQELRMLLRALKSEGPSERRDFLASQVAREADFRQALEQL